MWTTATEGTVDVGGLDPRRVAEVLVTGLDGLVRRGSGYRLATGTVLTTAHVLRDAKHVDVRFEADRVDEWRTPATVGWSDETVDLGILMIDGPAVEPVPFGRIRDADALLFYSTMGFPRFKLRAYPPGTDAATRYRDSYHEVGRTAVLSNHREGSLELRVDPPDPDGDPAHSPWEGMSGAAVLIGGHLVGVVRAHHPSDGLNRLAAVRVDQIHGRLSPQSLAELCALTGLAPTAGMLPDVVPTDPQEAVAAAYLAQVGDIAPERLLDRADELAEMLRFCAGDEPYLWWQGPPWAGKSSLAAWIVQHPPVGVQVVGFFITGRLRGQADSDAFTEAMIEQLAPLAGEAVPATASPAARDRHRRRLLDAAATRVASHGRQLLVVVDGLDEDQSAAMGRGVPSIAALLPARPSAAVKVMVTSRPHPGLPTDVEQDHPLRRCLPRQLAPSPHAENAQHRALHELRERLSSRDGRETDVVSFITASGGGLSRAELSELTGEPGYVLEDLLGGEFGRSMQTRAARPATGDDGHQVYLFAHDTLRTIAEEQLGADLEPYRRRIHDWAQTYRSQGWPEHTPPYLRRPYAALLAATGDHVRLTALATDPARHARLLASTHGDAATLAEIAAAQQLLLREPLPDLPTLAVLGVHRLQIAGQAGSIPTGLPGTWVRLGDVDRAVALVQSIADPAPQQSALGRLVERLAEAGRWDLAERMSHAFEDPERRTEALAGLIGKVAAAEPGRWRDLADDAMRAAADIPDAPARAVWLTRLSARLSGLDANRAWRAAEDAERAAGAVLNVHAEARVLVVLVRAVLALDHEWALRLADRALELGDRGGSADQRATILTSIAANLASVDPERARKAAERAERAIRGERDADRRTKRLTKLAAVLTAAGMYDQAERVTHLIHSLDRRAEASAALVEGLVAAQRWRKAEHVANAIGNRSWRSRAHGVLAAGLMPADPRRARRHAATAERAAASIAAGATRARALTVLVQLLLPVDPDRATRLIPIAAAAAQETENRSGALSGLARVLTAAARWTEAGEVAAAVPNPVLRSEALGLLATALAAADARALGPLADAAEAAARALTDPSQRAAAWTQLIGGLASAAPERVAGLARQAENAAAAIKAATGRALALSNLADVLAKVDPDRARLAAEATESVARTIVNPHFQVRALVDIIGGLAVVAPARAAELIDRAMRAAGSLQGNDAPVAPHNQLFQALAKARQWSLAEQVAAAIVSRNERALAHVDLVARLASVDGSAAMRIADEVELLAAKIAKHPRAAKVLTGLAKALSAVDGDRVLRLADTVEQLGTFIGDRLVKAQILVELAGPVSRFDNERALRLLVSAESAALAAASEVARVEGLADVVRALVLVDADRALAVAERAAVIAEGIAGPGQRGTAFADLAEALAAVDPRPAREMAGLAERAGSADVDPAVRARTLIEVVRALSVIDTAEAVRVATLVEKAASGVSSPDTRSNLIARLATTLAESGLSELAEEAAEVVVGAEQRARALATVAGLCTDEVDRADGLAEAAIHTALGIVDATARSAVLARLTTVFAEAHLWDRAEGAAGEIVQPATQKRALLSVINRLVEAIRQRSGPESDGAEDRLLRLGAVILSGADPVGLLTPLAAVHPRLVLDACDAMLPLVLGSPQQP